MMRIITGTHRSRPLDIPPPAITRPTSDKVRGAVFNLLHHRDWFGDTENENFPENAVVLDLFAGSGALGLEAVSRGAAQAFLIENHPKAASIITRNIESLGMESAARLVRADALHLPRAVAAAGRCDLVFADPPYGKGLIAPALQSARAGGWLAPRALIVGESEAREQIDLPASFERLEHRLYSDTAIWIWAYRASDGAP